jgi:pyruvate,water dikinase
MSHAAIVSREYGLPAVAATGIGTQVVHTGDRLRVDGNTGLVTILERAGVAAAGAIGA